MPLLVARDELEYPTIGYNVFEEVIKSPDQMTGDNTDSLEEIMGSAFSEVKQESVTALVDLVQSASAKSVLRSGRNNLMVPRGQTVAVICRVDCGPLGKRTPVLRMMCFSVMTQAYSEKEIPSLPTGVEPTTFRLLVRTLYH